MNNIEIKKEIESALLEGLVPAVAYGRTSTEAQGLGYGIEAQEFEMEKYASMKGYKIIHIFKDEAVSGKVDIRPEWESLKDFMVEFNISVCVIPELSRIGRDTVLCLLMVNDIWKLEVKDKEGKKIKPLVDSARNGMITADNQEHKLMFTILAAISDYEHSVIVSRMKGGRHAKARKGEHAQGSLAYGYKLETQADGKRKMVVDEKEAQMVRLVFELRADGLSLEKIAKYLNDNGYEPKRANSEKAKVANGKRRKREFESEKPKFHHTTINKILNNEKYIGLYKLHSEGEIVANVQNESIKILDEKLVRKAKSTKLKK